MLKTPKFRLFSMDAISFLPVQPLDGRAFRSYYAHRLRETISAFACTMWISDLIDSICYRLSSLLWLILRGEPKGEKGLKGVMLCKCIV